MKHVLLTGAFFALHVYSTAQCSDCHSLEEALKDPSRVRHLDLSNQGLHYLPDSVRYLTGLETLDLSQNFFTTVDLKGAQLERVWQLNLSGNIGLDPLEMEQIASAFPNLLNLDLSDSRIAYLTPEISRFKQLLTLDLSGNELQFLPEDLKDIRQLSTLNISGNNISDITYVLSNCWNIRTLNASDNPFDPDALLISLSQANHLDHLTYSYIEPGREGSKALAELQLRSLELIGINEEGLPPALTKNLSISHLTLTDCRFTQDIVPVLHAMSGLQQLTLDNTMVPDKLSKVDNLSSLELIRTPCPSHSALSKLTFLDELDVTLVDISDSVAQTIPALLPKTAVRTSLYNYAPEMTGNKVPEIRAAETVEQQIAGDEAVQLVVDDIAFDVPRQAFLNADGTVYSGPVTLKVTNYDNAITNALAGAPMIMESNGQQEVFASSGMLDFRATDTQGNELQPNPDNQIQVTITNQRPDEAVNLYQYNDSLNRWFQLQTAPQVVSYDSLRAAMIDSINRLDLNSFVNFQSVPTLFGLKVLDKKWDPSLLQFSSYNHKAGFSGNAVASQARVRYYEQNNTSRAIARRQWRIDTLVTPQLAAKLQEIQCAQKIASNVRNSVRYDNMPRLIQELSVVPDFANDNYRMTFRYKDTLISLPVFIETNKRQGRSMMREYARFQQQLDRAAKKDNRLKRAYDRDKKDNWEKLAEDARAMAIARVMNLSNFALQQEQQQQQFMQQQQRQQQEQLRFGLSGFGLVNCDFFYRNVPDQYAVLAEVLTDQNGEEVKAPEFVRTVLPQPNVYLSSYRQTIPRYISQPTIVLLLLSATELGVIKLSGQPESKEISSFRRINIDGKSNDEVRDLINY